MQDWSNGAACIVEMATVKLFVETLKFADSVLSVMPSLCRIATMYAVIAEPPLLGAARVIVALL